MLWPAAKKLFVNKQMELQLSYWLNDSVKDVILH